MSDEVRCDAPKIHYTEDELGFAPLSAQLARLIHNAAPQNGLSIGLFGRWGAGKTTVINFAEAYLKELPPAEQPTIVKFNPWWFSGQEVLISRFFEEVLKALKNDSKTNEAWKKLAVISETLGAVPALPHAWIAKSIYRR